MRQIKTFKQNQLFSLKPLFKSLSLQKMKCSAHRLRVEKHTINDRIAMQLTDFCIVINL